MGIDQVFGEIGDTHHSLPAGSPAYAAYPVPASGHRPAMWKTACPGRVHASGLG
jgi:hypothetical protein